MGFRSLVHTHTTLPAPNSRNTSGRWHRYWQVWQPTLIAWYTCLTGNESQRVFHSPYTILSTSSSCRSYFSVHLSIHGGQRSIIGAQKVVDETCDVIITCFVGQIRCGLPFLQQNPSVQSMESKVAGLFACSKNVFKWMKSQIYMTNENPQ